MTGDKKHALNCNEQQRNMPCLIGLPILKTSMIELTDMLHIRLEESPVGRDLIEPWLSGDHLGARRVGRGWADLPRLRAFS